MTTHAELDAREAELRAQAHGSNLHSHDIGLQLVAIQQERAALPVEQPDVPEVIHTEHSLEEAEAMLEAMAVPNEHLKASIKEARASLDNGNLHVNEPAEPEPVPEFLAAIGATP